MSKASESALGDLHAAVALSLANAISAPMRDGEGNPIDGTEGVLCSAAVLSAAITFLKNNNITADADTNEGLKDLKDKLEARRKDRKAAMQGNKSAAADFEDRLKMLGQ